MTVHSPDIADWFRQRPLTRQGPLGARDERVRFSFFGRMPLGALWIGAAQKLGEPHAILITAFSQQA